MPGLVHQLQQIAMGSSTPLSEVLRTARVVASKLGLVEDLDWINHELNGYDGATPPPYRRVRGDLRARNPYNGYMMPIRVLDPAVTITLETTTTTQPVSELEHLLSQSSQQIQVRCPYNHREYIRSNAEEHQREWIDPVLIIPRNSLIGILDTVRNRVLEWSLDLERRGIIGEGLAFSENEKAAAKQMQSVHIGQFNGVLGNVAESTVNVQNFGTLWAQLKKLDIAKPARDELESLWDEYDAAQTEPTRQSIRGRVAKWLEKHPVTVGSATTLISSLFGLAH